MMNLQLVATIATAVALGATCPKLVRHIIRRARNDYSLRPAMWERFYAVDWGDTTTNNYGFAPARGDHPERFQHEMYLQLLDLLLARRKITAGMSLLEVSCGRGGGLNALLAQSPGLQATGLDISGNAIDFCRRTYGKNEQLRFVQGSALDLPFSDASFDASLNVEASHDYGDRGRFFREIARVLKPDGVFLYADTTRAGQREDIERNLAEAGFIAELRDITSNVVEACRLDTLRRVNVIRNRAPMMVRLLFKRELDNYAGIEGSSKFHAFVDGRKGYVMTAAVRA